METFLIILTIVLVLSNGFLVWFFLKSKNSSKAGDSGLNLILQQMNELAKVVDSKMGETSRQVNEAIRFHYGDSQKLIKEITRELTEVKETGKQVISFADQLQSLQDILKNPKQRGVLGEYYLETLLKNVLPPGSFQMQYSFPDGTIVDAVVFVKDRIIPIDSKFSLENYNRLAEERDQPERKRLEKVFENDLKNRIVETSKYIQPDKGTMEFAFMFIPHEAIYYDLLIGKVGLISEENLIQRAASKYKVIIVSPTSFLAYLQTVLQGLNALQIEEKAQDIVKRVGELGKHIKAFEDYNLKLGNSLKTTVNQYNLGSKELNKIDKDVLRITGSAPGIVTEFIDKPADENS